MNGKQSKRITRKLFEANVPNRGVFRLKDGTLYNAYKRERNKLKREFKESKLAS